MYKVGQDNKMRRCLTISKAHIVLKELHEGVVGGCCNPIRGNVRMKLTLPKLGLGSPWGLPKL